jgi:hypothetical protein
LFFIQLLLICRKKIDCVSNVNSKAILTTDFKGLSTYITSNPSHSIFNLNVFEIQFYSAGNIS